VQDWIIAPRMRTAPGLAGVDVNGGYVKEYAVRPDPARLAAHGLSLGDLVQALERANTQAGAGYIQRAGEALTVRTDALAQTVEDLAQAPVVNRNGLVVRVADVATVEIGQAPRLGGASRDGHEAVIGTALMLAGENSRTVAQAAAERLEQISASLPPDIVAEPVLNRSALVNSTIKTVAKNLTEGALLVIVVLFLLLGNIRAATITALMIPISFLFAVIGMNRFGISGNLMSLGALDFGLLVDGAVVVVENTLLMPGAARAGSGPRPHPPRTAGRRRWRRAADGQARRLRPADHPAGLHPPADAGRGRGQDLHPHGRHGHAGPGRRLHLLLHLRPGHDGPAGARAQDGPRRRERRGGGA
jgi:cobalt-zinc-cadmium resistance protein CzcA